MIPTRHYVTERFRALNKMIFNGMLPEIPVLLSDSGRFLGLFSCRFKKDLSGKRVPVDCKIRVNARADLPAELFDNTIIHEMIHYYIAWKGIEDNSAHGKVFRRMMKEINARFGCNVCVRHRTTPEHAEQLVNSRRSWHIIAVGTLLDGRTALKVLPRSAVKVAAFLRDAKVAFGITELHLYLHDNPFFNRFPTSTALKMQIVDKTEINEHLSQSVRLELDGNRLIRKPR